MNAEKLRLRRALKIQVEEASALLKSRKQQLEIMDNEIMDQMLSEGVSSMKIDGTNFIVSVKQISNIEPEFKIDVIEYFLNNDRDLLTVNPQSLRSYIKECAENNQNGFSLNELDEIQLPAGLENKIKFFEKKTLSQRKA